MNRAEETYSNDSIECPYCGYDHTDDLPYEEGTTDFSCESCDKEFQVSVSCRWSWTGTPKEPKS